MAEFEDTTVTIDLPAELVEIIFSMGFTPKGYFAELVKQIEVRYEKKVQDTIIADNQTEVDTEKERVKDKTKVKSKET